MVVAIGRKVKFILDVPKEYLDLEESIASLTISFSTLLIKMQKLLKSMERRRLAKQRVKFVYPFAARVVCWCGHHNSLNEGCQK